MMDDKNEIIKRDTFNFLNFIIFFVLYIFVIIYQYALNDPTSYYISLGVDIFFSIFLISYTQILFTNYDTIISIISGIVIFAFIVTRLLSIIIFSDTFLKIEKKRISKGCQYEDMSKLLQQDIYLNRVWYLYSTLSILALLYMLMFWSDKINKIKLGITDYSKQQVVTYIIFALIITFSTLNTVWSFEVNRKYKRTEICDKKPSEETEKINKYNINTVLRDPIIKIK
tara:strand:+ start:4709 stop:5389 length:681 start_codon:yes stop_codon:yes gene_type:complete